MSIPKPSSTIFLLLALVTAALSFTANASECVGNGNLSVYWGEKSPEEESTLDFTCGSSGRYTIVILQSLIVYDNGKTPRLNLGNHCGSAGYPCYNLESQIKSCQQRFKVRVFLSIAIDRTLSTTNSNLTASPDAAENLANYLLENFLSGKPGPLGNVSLDGIDFPDVSEGENLHWDEVVKAINASTTARKIYLSASPQCVYPDHYLGSAIRTGLFDYIRVQFFYQNRCIYTPGNPSNLFSEWNQWTKNVPNSLIFLGLVASPEVAGYIDYTPLINDVLPFVRQSSNYGGVMIWNRYYDKPTYYSVLLQGHVQRKCRCVCEGDDGFAPNGLYGLRSGSQPLSI
ncbi:unnamed protein product [Sphenostylis stenocarpa]|uniref:GH18 domain-containing protein n=1 Tax=Sphenostylis stenocarpa TaxID=92480 RepID=A0AA86SU12_9FABA|nr:unnamed protein product [Sphenostylis stenocarpa]